MYALIGFFQGQNHIYTSISVLFRHSLACRYFQVFDKAYLHKELFTTPLVDTTQLSLLHGCLPTSLPKLEGMETF